MTLSFYLQTSLACISTPEGRNNIYTWMLTCKNPITKQPVFHSIRLGGHCTACAVDPVKAIMCNHVPPDTPPWISAARRDAFEPLYANRKHEYAREFLGLITDEGGEFIRQEFINALAEAPCLAESTATPLVFIGIDPSGGGADENGGSETAAVAMAKIGATTAILGMGCTPIGDQIDRQTAFLHELVGLIRQRAIFSNCPIIVACEAAPGAAAAVIEASMRALPQVHFMREMAGDQVGVLISEKSMHQMSWILQGQMATGQIRYTADCFSVGPHSLEDLKLQLLTEMGNLGWKKIGKKREFDDQRMKLTAKVTNSSADLIMALMHVLKSSTEFLISDRQEYIEWRTS